MRSHIITVGRVVYGIAASRCRNRPNEIDENGWKQAMRSYSSRSDRWPSPEASGKLIT
jgi:hypothetical protein